MKGLAVFLGALMVGLMLPFIASAPAYAAMYVCEDGTSFNSEDYTHLQLTEIPELCNDRGGFSHVIDDDELGSDEDNNTVVRCDLSPRGFLGFPGWYQYLQGERDQTGRCQPRVEIPDDFLPIGVAILDFMLRLAGILSAVFVIVGGYKYILSKGEPEEAKKARSTVLNALIGLAITIVATGIVTFIGNRFGE